MAHYRDTAATWQWTTSLGPITKHSKFNGLQGQEKGLGNKAKDLTFKAKARHLTFKAKAKDLKIVLKISIRARQRTPITGRLHLNYWVRPRQYMA